MKTADTGLYVHVPFCFSKCDYCGFYSVVPAADAFSRYFDRLAQEAAQRLPAWPGKIRTLFIGGGNPTATGIDGIKRLIDTLWKYVDPAELTEITFESNPETLTREIADFMATLPGIRLSMGMQRLNDDELSLLGRSARLDAVYRALDIACARIDNVGGDFILGVPGCDSIAERLAALVAGYPLRHVSAYFLTVEENTPMQRAIAAGQMPDPAETGPEELFQVRDVLTAAGFEHYEISNYSRPGYRCRHNLNYWQPGNYIGLGPAAVSGQGLTRTSNPADLQKWLNGCDPEVELLSQTDSRNEHVMLRLRLVGEGLDLDVLQKAHGRQSDEFFAALAQQLAAGHLNQSGNIVRLTDMGLAIADHVMGSLFI